MRAIKRLLKLILGDDTMFKKSYSQCPPNLKEQSCTNYEDK